MEYVYRVLPLFKICKEENCKDIIYPYLHGHTMAKKELCGCDKSINQKTYSEYKATYIGYNIFSNTPLINSIYVCNLCDKKFSIDEVQYYLYMNKHEIL